MNNEQTKTVSIIRQFAEQRSKWAKILSRICQKSLSGKSERNCNNENSLIDFQEMAPENYGVILVKSKSKNTFPINKFDLGGFDPP